MRTLGRQAPSERNEPFLRRHMLYGLALIGVFCGGMALWSSLAPLGSAVVAPGVVSVESHRKAVQHLEGGIVGQILVKDGARVKRGDVLIELSNVAASTNVERLKSQYYEALATTARLTAERDGAAEITWPEALIQTPGDERIVEAAKAAQLKVFGTRNRLHEQQIGLLSKRIDRHQKESEGLRQQIKAVEQQLSLIKQESTDTAALFEKQLTRKTRLLDVQRQESQIESRQSALQSSLAQVEQEIIELELKKTELQSATLASVVDDLRDRQARAQEYAQELVAAKDVLTRTKILAPIDGTVVGMQVYSRDGVISPGQTLMQIVPLSDDLVIEAKLAPEDVEEVRAGLPANVVLHTLTRRYNQPVRGTLDSVSADRLVDPLTARAYYQVRVKVDAASIDTKDTKLLAGMSADVFIQTGDRTAFAYLAAPILRTINHGMREN